MRKLSWNDWSTSGLNFKYYHAIEAPPIWGMWWEATPSLLMWFMRSPEAPAQLHPSVGATYYCNTPNLLFSWLMSTSIFKNATTTLLLWRLLRTKRKQQRGTIVHLTSLSPKCTFTTQSPVSSLTCSCALTQISLEYCSVKAEIAYLTALSSTQRLSSFHF